MLPRQVPSSHTFRQIVQNLDRCFVVVHGEFSAHAYITPRQEIFLALFAHWFGVEPLLRTYPEALEHFGRRLSMCDLPVASCLDAVLVP